MARNRTVVGNNPAVASNAKELTEEDMNAYGKALEPLAFASSVQMGIGVDLLGSKMSLVTKASGNKLAVTAVGIVAFSRKTGRCVLVPWANVRGAELERVQPKPVEPVKA